jgi:hypothetical protein
MSSVPNSITQVDRYPGIAAISTKAYRPDESIGHGADCANPAFLNTIVGRRGGLRSIFSQVEQDGRAAG